jgi:hypothetical protein
MIANDETAKSTNYTKLLAEAKKGTKINVDGVYYLYAAIESSNANEVNAGLSLIGNSPTTSKLILQGGTFFNLKGSALIENISIEAPTSRQSTFISMVAPFINNITIRNNYITGDIRLVSSSVAVGYDFISNQCYIENLTIERNEFYDVYGTSGKRVIILTEDTPVKLALIKNNKITNFSYGFYFNGITNGNTSTQYLIENNNAIIENNIVTCTDDYDALSRNSGVVAGVYYSFALIEGFSVEVRNNTFEGIHISDAPGMMVYDNYFSVTKLVYEKNIWKNNINFTPDIQYVDIMKSKFGTDANGIKTERVYRNNTYIVEPSYADKFGKDRFLLRKSINGWQADMNSIIIEDNYFDMYILSFDYFGQRRWGELYKFNRNTVLMDTIEHKSRQAFITITNMKDENGNFIPRSAEVIDNTYTVDTAAFGSGAGTSGFYLILPYLDGVKSTVQAGDLSKVTITGNNIQFRGTSANIKYTNEAAEVAKHDEIILGSNPERKYIVCSGNTITVLP